MRMFYLYFVLTILPLQAEVISYGDDYIRYEVPSNWLRKASANSFFREYFLWDDVQASLLVQVHKNRKWAQWHMRGLPGKHEAFADYWQKETSLYETGMLKNVVYDSERYVLSMTWERPDGKYMLSRMKLTSFGCIAFHRQGVPLEEIEAVDKELAQVLNSIALPERLQFYPEDLVSEIVDNMGGAVVFIVLSMMYLMFSLFQRSSLQQRRMEMRLHGDRPYSQLDFD